MTFAKGILAALALAAAVGQASATELEHWPAPAARQLNALIEATRTSGAYAVFDMDNTSYRYDLEESLLPYLEMKGVLTRDRLDPSLKLIPFKDQAGHKESLFSYYYRLCEIDDMVCYPWVEVYAISAAHEELVRMVAADPRYGYNAKPENVIGVTTLLKNARPAS